MSDNNTFSNSTHQLPLFVAILSVEKLINVQLIVNNVIHRMLQLLRTVQHLSRTSSCYCERYHKMLENVGVQIRDWCISTNEITNCCHSWLALAKGIGWSLKNLLFSHSAVQIMLHIVVTTYKESQSTFS